TVPAGADVRGAPGWDDPIFEVTTPASTVVLSHIGIRFGGGGGCVSNRGSLTMTRVRVDHCSAGFSGGGIFNYSSGSVTLTDSEIDGNSSRSYGGGIGNEGVMVLTNTTVDSNTATYGAGIENSGRLTV